MTRYLLGSYVFASLDKQKEHAKKLSNKVFPVIYEFFESTYDFKSEEVGIHNRSGASDNFITIKHYQIADISDLMLKSGVPQHRVDNFQEDLTERATDGYFGRESFVITLLKNRLLNQIIDYCSEDS